MLTRKHLVAARLMELQKGQPTATQVHVPNAGDDTKRRRRRAAQLLVPATDSANSDISKADKPGMYVGRRVLNGDQLQQWWLTQARPGEPTQLDANPHITVSYSRVEFPWVNDPCAVMVPPPCFLQLQLLGPDNAVVLKMDAPLLEARWQSALNAGASWDHDGYQPHVTLFYLGADYSGDPLRAIAVPDFPLILGPELSGPRGSDVFAPADPDWYTPPA